MFLKFYLLLAVTSLLALPNRLQAEPPRSQQWRPIPELSDDFNTQHNNPDGNGLDPAKWWGFHPTWSGRLPSQFSKENTWVADGMLHLRATSLINDISEVEDPVTDHWVNTAAVTSRAEAQPGDYFEARIRGANASLPSSWWFRQGAKTEIDVIENIGNPSDTSQSMLASMMAYNTHIDDPGPLLSKGGFTPMVDSQGNPLRSSENFIVYGVWWQSPRRLHFYYNGKHAGLVVPDGLFDEGINMIFDMEVFPWVGLPTIASLQDNQRNTMRVDWVRAYRRVNVAGSPMNLIDNPSFERSHPGEPQRPEGWADCGFDGCNGQTPFESRSNQTSRTGRSSLRIDNSQANFHGMFKQVRNRDDLHSVLPGQTVHHEVWVKIPGRWANPDATFALGLRLNGDSAQGRTGPGSVTDGEGQVIATYGFTTNGIREYPINNTFGGAHRNRWVKLEHNFVVPEFDSDGNPVNWVTSIAFINNKTTTEPSRGFIFLDDFKLEIR